MPIDEKMLSNLDNGAQPSDSPDPIPSAANSSGSAQLPIFRAMPGQNMTPAPQGNAAQASGGGSTSASPVQASTGDTQPPQPSDQTDSDEMDAAHKLAAYFKQQEPAKDEEKQKKSKSVPWVEAAQEIHKRNGGDDDGPILDPRKPDEGVVDYMSRLGREELAYLASQNRANAVGGGIDKKKTVFDSMYGPDNVELRKTAKGEPEIYFRPDADSKFRKADQLQSSVLTDFVARHAQELLQGAAAATVGAGTAGAVTGSVAGPGGTALGFLGGGLAGAGTFVASRMAAEGAFDAASQIPTNRSSTAMQSYHQALSDTLSEAKYWLGGAVTGKVLAQGLRPVAESLAESPMTKGAVDGLVDTLASFNFEKSGPNALEQNAQMLQNAQGALVDTTKDFLKKPQAEQNAKLLGTIREAVQSFLPRPLSTYAKETQPATGQYVASVLEDKQRLLGQKIGVIEDDIVRRSEESGIKARVDNVITEMKDVLQQYDFTFDSTGRAKPPIFSRSLDEGGGLSNSRRFLLDLAERHNSYVSEQNVAGGLDGRRLFKNMDSFAREANFKSADPSPEEQIWRQIYNAGGKDRLEFANSVLDGDSSEAARTFKNDYKNYSDFATDHAKIASLFKTDATADQMIRSIASAKGPEQQELLTGLKNTLGSDSEAWERVRGSLFSEMIDRAVDPASKEFFPSKFLKQFNQMAESTSRIIAAPEERALISRVAGEATNLKTAATLNANQKNIIKDLILMPLGKIPKVGIIFKMMGGSKVPLDYATTEAPLEIMQSRAVTPDQKKSLLNFMRNGEMVIGNMRPVKATERGKEFLKYVGRPSPSSTYYQGAGQGVAQASTPDKTSVAAPAPSQPQNDAQAGMVQ